MSDEKDKDEIQSLNRESLDVEDLEHVSGGTDCGGFTCTGAFSCESSFNCTRMFSTELQ